MTSRGGPSCDLAAEANPLDGRLTLMPEVLIEVFLVLFFFVGGCDWSFCSSVPVIFAGESLFTCTDASASGACVCADSVIGRRH